MLRPGFPVIVALATFLSPAAPPHQAFAVPVVPVIDVAEGTGSVVLRPGAPIQTVTIALDGSVPVERIPAKSLLRFRWHAEPPVVDGYRYHLSGPFPSAAFTEVDSSVHGVDLDTEGIGPYVFTLRAIVNQTVVGETFLRFQVGMSPRTWIAGPDLAALDARFGWSGPPRSLAIPDWNALPDLLGSLLSCDSLTLRPGDRPERRTFFEIYGDRLYVHTEGDTVHMNSWVVVHGGGHDADSPYLPALGPSPALDDTGTCAAEGTPWVVRDGGFVGSPIGHRSLVSVRLVPNNILHLPGLTRLFPNFDSFSVLYLPRIADYRALSLAGKAYLLLKAEDSDGSRDNAIDNPASIVDAVDGGTGTPEQIALRPRILTFYVDKAPFLRTGEPGFVPQPSQVFAGRTLDLHLLAGDLDPYDLSGGTPPPGGPTATGVLRWNVSFRGRGAGGRDTTIAGLPGPVFTPDITLEVPAAIAGPELTVRVELCDCAECENVPGSGRCVTHEIPVTVASVASVPIPARAELALHGIEPNPSAGRLGLVRISLAGTGGARCELLDVSGRRIAARELDALGPGRHDIRLGPEAGLPAGVYLLRLIEGGRTRTARAAVIR